MANEDPKCPQVPEVKKTQEKTAQRTMCSFDLPWQPQKVLPLGSEERCFKTAYIAVRFGGCGMVIASRTR
eukprot:5457198-Amphidinium_carterae.2